MISNTKSRYKKWRSLAVISEESSKVMRVSIYVTGFGSQVLRDRDCSPRRVATEASDLCWRRWRELLRDPSEGQRTQASRKGDSRLFVIRVVKTTSRGCHGMARQSLIPDFGYQSKETIEQTLQIFNGPTDSKAVSLASPNLMTIDLA